MNWLTEPSQDEQTFLTDFWRRSVDKNTATGKPPPFQVFTDTQKFDTKPFPRPLDSIVAPSTSNRGLGLGQPRIDSFDPYWDDIAGAGYTVPGNPNIVTIRGSNFMPSASVQFDGIDAPNVIVHDTTRITCQTPPNSVGPTRWKLVDVAVSNVTPFDAGISDSLGTFQYERVPYMMSLNGLTSIDNGSAVGIGNYPVGSRQVWPMLSYYNALTTSNFPWIGWLNVHVYPVGGSPTGQGAYFFMLNGSTNIIETSSGAPGAQFIVTMKTFETNPSTFAWVYGIS